MGRWLRFKYFNDMGRAQGITTTAAFAMGGALSASVSIGWHHIVLITLTSAVFHESLNIFIAKGDLVLDAHTYTPDRNAVVTGDLSMADVMRGFWMLAFLTFTMPVFFAFTNLSSAADILMMYIMLGMGFLFLIWYGYRGKRYLVSFDWTFSASFFFWTLFGVYAIGGRPTEWTWYFMLPVIFVGTAFAQWENGLKDVQGDIAAGVRSFAIWMGFKPNMRIGFSHPYFVYGVMLKVGMLAGCILAYLAAPDPLYAIFLAFYAVPAMGFVLYRFATKVRAIDHRRTILYDVPLTAIIAFSTLIGKVGWLPILALICYVIIGYLAGSSVQENCEFKFGRSKKLKG